MKKISSKYRHKIRILNKNSKKGFTMVEMVVTLVVLSILLAVSVGSVIGWRAYAEFKKQNEYAQTLYTAAQMQLTEYSANGRLDYVENIMETAGTELTALNSITLDDGSKASEDSIWNHSQSSDLYYIIATKEDYKKYKNSVDGVSESVKLLYDMLDNYLYDKSILEATVCLEFDPSEGLVYSVLYSERAENFEYNDENENESDTIDISDRTNHTRREKMLGYYGVETLSKSTSAKTQKPVITNLKLNNENTLNLTWTLDKSNKDAIGQLTYEIVVYSEESKKPLMSIKMNNLKKGDDFNETDLNGMNNTLKSQTATDGNYPDPQTIAGKVEIYEYNDDGTTTSKNMYTQFKAYIDSSNRVYFVLDAVDLEASETAYTDMYDNSGELNSNYDVITKNTFSNTYSILRFGFKDQEIYCTVKGSGANYKTTATKVSNTHDMLYGSNKVTEKGSGDDEMTYYEYKIANMRHLYNIRFNECKAENRGMECEYLLTDNSSWSGTDSILEKNDVYVGQNLVTAQDTPFPSISKLRSSSEFKSNNPAGISSRTYTLSGLILNYETIGAKSISDPNTVQNVTKKNEEANNTDTGTGTGLFIKNYGTMKYVKLGSILVNGITSGVASDATGTFCAYNGGNLTDLTVTSGTVTGKDYVGGIYGKQIDPTIVTYKDKNGKGISYPVVDEKNQYTATITVEKVTNYATVTGSSNVGGITGCLEANVRYVNIPSDANNPNKVQDVTLDQLRANKLNGNGNNGNNGNGNKIYEYSQENNTYYFSNTKNNGNSENKVYVTTAINLTNCNNYGAVYGSGSNIGGIAGYTQNYTLDAIIADSKEIAEEDKKDKIQNIVLYKCESSPKCDSVDAAIALYDKTVNDHKVSESKNVGGIVGLNEYALIKDCSTVSSTQGYIVGGTNVGGIVGQQASKGSLIKATMGTVINNANVIGKSCVGGIIGENSNTLKDCVNTGIVAAYEDYAGGITGKNEGIIDSCKSECTEDEISRAIFAAVGQKADYVGGITGYNSGTLKAADNTTVSVTAVVNGCSYVGGIIGYNDNKSDDGKSYSNVSGYKLIGGYIYGKNFVGGYVGANLSSQLVSKSDSYILTNPNDVTGIYAVGGIIGGNIVASDDDITTQFETDNFLGIVEGEAFVGGYIGYNAICKESSNVKKIITDINSLYKNNEIISGDSDETAVIKINNCVNGVSETYSGMDSILGSNISSATFKITGEKNINNNESKVRLDSLSARLYVGGVVGYNNKDTKLAITNISNNTPITATAAVENKNFTTETGNDHLYSYAGGIIGYVSPKTIITNCKNNDVGEVTSGGTYTGGLCEVNAGEIINCEAVSIGGSDESYVGGIAGLNLGKVDNSTLNSLAAVMGKDYTGGLVAENLGTITDAKALGTIIGYGENIGGIAGYNGSTGTITIKDNDHNESGSEVNLSSILIEGTGTNVGGIIGYNKGSLSSASANKITVIGSLGNIEGSSNVGGVIGREESQKAHNIENYINRSVVAADNGNAGGIVGIISTDASKTTISNCYNYGLVQASLGNAGGIIADNSSKGVITNCCNYSRITAANGISGGICGTNQGNINKSSCKAQNSTFTLSGYEQAGEICGTNGENGTITECYVSGITITNLTSSAGGELGAIAGSNKGTINSNNTVNNGMTVDNVTVKTLVNKANCGGIAGLNKGTIDGAVGDNAENAGINCKITMDSGASFANLGGAVGDNQGKISNCKVLDSESKSYTINGNQGASTYGYGGIAGISGNNGSKASITNCSFDGTIYGDGTASAVANVGGIAGKNLVNSTITNCTVGKTNNTTIRCGTANGAYGFTGVITGWNLGHVISCDNKTNSQATVQIIGYSGHCGGIVGNNGVTGEVTGIDTLKLTTGSKWSVTANYYSNDCGTGGIIGYSNSGKNMSYVENYASVTNTMTSGSNNTAVGGIIGRLENNTYPNFTISNSSNHGKITGKVITGGIIGRMKYQGITIKKTDNYGKVGNSANIASGIIASVYHASTQAIGITITSSKNYGEISSNSKAGGIFGDIMNMSGISNCGKAIISIADCINTGVISGSNTAGIFGNNSLDNTNNSKLSLSLYRCRNYGLGMKKGISNAAVKNMSGCFNFSDNQTLADALRTDSPKNNNFYVVKTDNSNVDIGSISSENKQELKTTKKNDKYALSNNYNKNKTSIVSNINIDPMGSDENNNYYNDKKDYTNESFELSYRYKLIKEIESELEKYYNGIYKEVEITTIAADDIGGAYKVTWTTKDNAVPYRYDLLYTVTGGEKNISGEIPVYDQETVVDIKDSWFDGIAEGDKLTIKFTVKAVYIDDKGDEQQSPDVDTEYDKNDTKKYYNSISKEINSPLPVPLMHLELVSTDASENKNFKVVLENKSDYEGNKACTIQYKYGNFTTTFNSAKGESDPFSVGTGVAANKTMTIQALANNNYGASVIKSVMTFTISADQLNLNDYLATAFNGFYGETMSDMEYNIKVTGQKSIDAYYYTELVYHDNELGIDVSAGWGESHATAGQTVTASITDIPKEYLDGDNVIIRSYPWKTQNDVIHYGHEVKVKDDKNQFSKLDLSNAIEAAKSKDPQKEAAAITDSQRANESIFNSNGNLNNGYVIQRNGNGTYRVIYSTIVANSQYLKKQIDTQEYTIDHSTQTDQLSTITGINNDTTKRDIQPSPIIETEFVKEEQKEETGFTFTWDKDLSGDNYESAIYYVTLVGISEDGTRVELETRENLTDNKAFFADTNWNYPNVELTVIRHGRVDKNKKTVKFASYATKELNVKLKLSTIAKPIITLHKDGTYVEKNSLLYDISWIGLDKISGVSATEKEAVDHYEVTISGTAGDKIFNTGQSTDNDAENMGDKLDTKITIDLNDFQRGDTISISVRAIAKSDNKTYRDGGAGVIRQITLPTRLYPPEMKDALIISNNYESEPLLEAVFENGITLTMTDSNTQDPNGHYEMAVEVYDKEYSEQDIENAAPLYTVGTKKKPVIMKGNLSKGTYTFEKLSADYAGKWIRVVMRSVSTSNISSVWTDAYVGDDSLESVAPSAWFQLPKVEISEPEFEETTQDYSYQLRFKGEYEPGEANVITAQQSGLTFTESNYASDYRIKIIHTMTDTPYTDVEEDGLANSHQYPVDYLTIHKTEDNKWEIYYASSDSSQNIIRTTDSHTGYYEQALNYDPDYGLLIAYGSIDSDNMDIQLPYTKEIFEVDPSTQTVTESSVILSSHLIISKESAGSEKARFTLVLPDSDNLKLVSDNCIANYHNTQSVVGEAIAGDQNNYKDSYAQSWYRTVDAANNLITAIQSGRTIADLDMPVIKDASNQDIDISKPVLYDTRYNAFILKTLSQSNKYYYNFKITYDDNGTTRKVSFISGFGVDKSNVVDTSLFIGSEYAGKTIKIYVQAVDTADNIVTKWSNDFIEVTLGGVTQSQEVKPQSIGADTSQTTNMVTQPKTEQDAKKDNTQSTTNNKEETKDTASEQENFQSDAGQTPDTQQDNPADNTDTQDEESKDNNSNIDAEEPKEVISDDNLSGED